MDCYKVDSVEKNSPQEVENKVVWMQMMKTTKALTRKSLRKQGIWIPRAMGIWLLRFSGFKVFPVFRHPR